MATSSTDRLRLRPLIERDAVVISQAFAALGQGDPRHSKPIRQFEQYLFEQQQGIRQCWVALLDRYFAGYVTLHWNPLYAGIAGKGVPEIQDLNVLPGYRRQGIATRLLERAEQSAALRATLVAAGVGLHPGFNAAQRLYARRGYTPDGLGVTYDDRYVEEGELVRLDDELVLHLVKPLGQVERSRTPNESWALPSFDTSAFELEQGLE